MGGDADAKAVRRAKALAGRLIADMRAEATWSGLLRKPPGLVY